MEKERGLKRKGRRKEREERICQTNVKRLPIYAPTLAVASTRLQTLEAMRLKKRSSVKNSAVQTTILYATGLSCR